MRIKRYKRVKKHSNDVGSAQDDPVKSVVDEIAAIEPTSEAEAAGPYASSRGYDVVNHPVSECLSDAHDTLKFVRPQHRESLQCLSEPPCSGETSHNAQCIAGSGRPQWQSAGAQKELADSTADACDEPRSKALADDLDEARIFMTTDDTEGVTSDLLQPQITLDSGQTGDGQPTAYTTATITNLQSHPADTYTDDGRALASADQNQIADPDSLLETSVSEETTPLRTQHLESQRLRDDLFAMTEDNCANISKEPIVHDAVEAAVTNVHPALRVSGSLWLKTERCASFLQMLWLMLHVPGNRWPSVFRGAWDWSAVSTLFIRR